jgi:hypothetical protein
MTNVATEQEATFGYAPKPYVCRPLLLYRKRISRYAEARWPAARN